MTAEIDTANTASIIVKIRILGKFMAKIILKKIHFSLGTFLFNINQEKIERIFSLKKFCFEADTHKLQESNSKGYHLGYS